MLQIVLAREGAGRAVDGRPGPGAAGAGDTLAALALPCGTRSFSLAGGAGASAGEEASLNRRAHPRQYIARSRFTVKQALQNLVISWLTERAFRVGRVGREVGNRVDRAMAVPQTL